MGVDEQGFSVCSGEMEGKVPPKACEEEGSKWGLRRGHCVFTAANLPRCKMINSSWCLSDQLTSKEVCTDVNCPEFPRGQSWSNLPFSNVLLVLGSLVFEDFLKVASSHPCLQASRLTNQCSSQ